MIIHFHVKEEALYHNTFVCVCMYAYSTMESLPRNREKNTKDISRPRKHVFRPNMFFISSKNTEQITHVKSLEVNMIIRLFKQKSTYN